MAITNPKSTSNHPRKGFLTSLICLAVLALTLVAFGPGVLSLASASVPDDLTAGTPGKFTDGFLAFEAPVTQEAQVKVRCGEDHLRVRNVGKITRVSDAIVVQEWTPTNFKWGTCNNPG